MMVTWWIVDFWPESNLAPKVTADSLEEKMSQLFAGLNVKHLLAWENIIK